MAIQLSPIEARVLGVLIEKSMTQAETYPLTLNAATLGCNQKTNRDPVMNLAEGQIAASMHELQRWQLVSLGDTQRGARANRFRHEVEKRFGWNAAQRAIMAELLLRGPQTLGELRTRASRMTPIGDVAYVTELMTELQSGEQPMVVELPRQPGQGATRWAHLLCGPVEASAVSQSTYSTRINPSPVKTTEPGDMAARIEALAAEVAELRTQLSELRGQIGLRNASSPGEA